MGQENYIKIEFRGGETGLVSNYYVSTKINYKGEQDSQIWMPECDSFLRFSR